MSQDNKPREQIFKEELYALKERSYITTEEYLHIHKAYRAYTAAKQAKSEQTAPEPAIPAERAESLTKPLSKPVNEPLTVTTAPPRTASPAAPAKVKVLSAQEIRDRNITWMMILGVILFLIGGSIFATSQWETMTSLLKTLCAAAVAALFFGLSYVSGKYMKIEKTSFAFLVLGSLFTPIVLLAAGYFKLFGTWFSLTGEGKYLFGAIAAALCIPMYASIAKATASRLFIWFSFLFQSGAAACMIAFIAPSEDWFYLGITVYNALLLAVHFRWKSNARWALFLRELPVFAQTNLIISTLFLLMFFDSPAFYSFNVLLTAGLYIAMTFVSSRKEYPYVFAVMLVYGIYQLIEHTALAASSALWYSFTGFIFIAMQSVKRDDASMHKLFRYISAVVSFGAFIYISYEGILLRSGNPSWLLAASYLLIAGNYLYLSNQAHNKLFPYLASIFLLTSGFQGMYAALRPESWETMLLPAFLAASVLFVAGYYINQYRLTRVIAGSSFHVSLAAMGVILWTAVWAQQWKSASVMLLIAGVLAWLMTKKQFVQIAAYTMPSSLFLAWLAWYPVFENAAFYEQHIALSGHFAAGALVLIGLHWLLRWRSHPLLDKPFFHIGTAAYIAALYQLLMNAPDNDGVILAILAAGVVLLIYAARLTQLHVFYGTVAVVSLALYLQLFHMLRLAVHADLTAYGYVLGSAVLLAVYTLLRKRAGLVGTYFFWTAHLYLPVAMAITVLHYDDMPAFALLSAAVLYLYSALMQQTEWQKKLFSYLGFAVTHGLLQHLGITHGWESYVDEGYVFAAMSFLLWAGWFFSAEPNRRRMEWFFIPYSVLGSLLFSLLIYNDGWLSLVVSIAYISFALYFLHRRGWGLAAAIPLLGLLAWLAQLNELVSNGWMLAVYVAAAIIVKQAGQHTHKTLVTRRSLDWYALFSLWIVSGTYEYTEGLLVWADVIFPIFLSWVIFSQRQRVPEGLNRKIVTTLSGLSGLLVYYTVLGHFEVPALLEKEVIVLPWIAMAIVLAKTTWKSYPKRMGQVQWGILLLVAAVLIRDGLQSRTVFDAILLGGLSLISLIAGAQLRIKAYFFTGIGVLLLNLMIQTKPMWGNMPWWAYLLLSGALLIGFAGYNEWRKKKEDGQEPRISLKERFKEWN